MLNWVNEFRKRRITRINSLTIDIANMASNLNPAPCSQEDLRKLLEYNEFTGTFVWIGHKYKKHNGKIAGNIHKGRRKFREIKIFGKKYKSHVLAYYYVTGIWSKIDHRDNDALNNMFKNLRSATDLENGRNKLITKNSLGYKGVSKINNSKKFQSSIMVNYKSIYLGSFSTPEEAYAAYCKAAKTYHKEFANTRRD